MAKVMQLEWTESVSDDGRKRFDAKTPLGDVCIIESYGDWFYSSPFGCARNPTEDALKILKRKAQEAYERRVNACLIDELI